MTRPRDATYTTGDGLRLFYRDWGDPLSPRTPLLCLPGLTRNSADFEDLAARHAGARRVICPDYRGRGRSDYDPDWRRYHPRVYLEDLRHLLAAEGVGRAVVVGTSMGGLLALGLRAAAPSSVAGVVLNDIGPDLSPGGLGRIAGYIGRDRPQPDWDSAVAELKRLMPRLSLDTEETWQRFARATYREGADGRLHFDWDVRLAKALGRVTGAMPDLWALFRGLRDVPVMAVRGGVSDLLSPETFDRMAGELPHLVRATVPGCGHCPTLGEPAVALRLDEFLDAIY
ncbi:MAG: alpha/beta hydrolase [Magnetospirillum sp.]|nr:alpha/beta hydrolase [Magnetospirillum sp.]